MSAGRVFFDTNVLVYMHGGGDATKEARSKEVFAEYASGDSALLSTQVVQEFYTICSRKLGMPQPELESLISGLLELPLVVIGPSEIRSAIAIEQRYRISFWDALIVAAAESGGAEILLTEDLNDGQHYGSVLVRNPFRL